MAREPATQPACRLHVSVVLRLIAAAGLGTDAAIHAHLAPIYDGVRAVVSEGDLFRAEAGLACLAGLGLLVTRRRSAVAAALLVATSAVIALVVSRSVDLGRLGPIPNLYEPAWSLQALTAVAAEAVAAIASGTLLVVSRATPPYASALRARVRPVTLALAAGASLGALALTGGATQASPAARGAVVQHVTIAGTNLLRFDPSIVHVRVGVVRITLEDAGAYPHNIEIPELNVTSPTVTGDPGGTVVRFTVDFPEKGRYRFDCVYHASAGMVGTFIVS